MNQLLLLYKEVKELLIFIHFSTKRDLLQNFRLHLSYYYFSFKTCPKTTNSSDSIIKQI